MRNEIKNYLANNGLKVELHYDDDDSIELSPLIWAYLGIPEKLESNLTGLTPYAGQHFEAFIKYLKRIHTEPYERKIIVNFLDENKSYTFRKAKFSKDKALSIGISEEVAEELGLERIKFIKLESLSVIYA